MGIANRFTTRQEIRDAVIELLLGSTEAGDNVFANRGSQVETNELPCILVYPSSEDYYRLYKTPSTHRADLSLAVEIMAQESATQSLSEILDGIADEVETILLGSDNLGGRVHDINISRAEGNFQGEGSRPNGSWVMIFLISYVRQPKE